MTVEELELLIKANTSELRKEIEKANKSISSMKKTADKSNNDVVNAFKKLKSTIVKLGIGKVIVDSIKNGMEAIESDNLFSVSLGKHADEVYEWSNTVSNALGLSAVEIRKNTGVIYNMTSSMGLAEKQALTMSKGVSLLANDMASFYNLDTEEAFNKIRAGITGETEPLKALGILVDENTIKQVAYSEGIATTGSELTQQQKVMARYMAILKQTGNAQGDLARTMNSPANLFRRLKTEITNCTTALGSIFIPVIQAVVPYIISFVRVITSALNGLASLFGIKQNGLSQETEKANVNAGGIATSVDNANKNAKKLKNTLAGFDEITNLSVDDSSGGSGEDVGGASGGSLDFEIPEYDAGLTGIEDKTTQIIDNVKSKFEDLEKYFERFKIPFEKWLKVDVANLGNTVINSFKTIFEGATDTIKLVFTDLFTGILPQIIDTFIIYILPFFTQFFEQLVLTSTTIFETINSLFQNVWSTGIYPALELIIKIWDGIWQTISTSWEKWGEPIFNLIRDAIVNTGNTLQNIWDTFLQPIWQNLLNMIDWLWTNHLQPLLANLIDFVAELVNLALVIYNNVILPIIDWVVDNLLPPIMVVINTIMDIMGTLFAVVVDIVDGIITFFKGIIQFLTGVFTGDLWKALERCKKYIWWNI